MPLIPRRERVLTCQTTLIVDRMNRRRLTTGVP
jgi:hypothetical protein